MSNPEEKPKVIELEIEIESNDGFSTDDDFDGADVPSSDKVSLHVQFERLAARRKLESIMGTVILCIVLAVCMTLALTATLILHINFPFEVLNGKRSDVIAVCVPAGYNDSGDEMELKGLCKRSGCIWPSYKEEGVPKCTFPEEHGYIVTGSENTTLGHTINLTWIEGQKSLYGNDSTEIIVEVEFQTNNRLHVKFKDPNEARYEVPEAALPIPALPGTAPPEAARLYAFSWVTKPQFGFQITRKSNGRVIFDTRLPGLTFSDQYLQLTSRLSSDNVYGFGEHNHRQLKHDMKWRRWAIFTRDAFAGDPADWPLYGAQPFYMNLESDGNANGVFLKNSNAMDIVLQPNPYPAVSYHVTGGILDFYFFLGPSPESIVQQYTELVGRPLMPPYWSLGYHLSKWDYGNITVVKEVLDRNRAADIPQDVQYGDVDYMHSYMLFTYNHKTYQGLPALVDDIHAQGMKYIVILDPGLGIDEKILHEVMKDDKADYTPYEDGQRMDIFVKNASGEILKGKVWPGLAVYPDFQNPATQVWWKKWITYLRDTEGIKFDGLWIDMNEPSSFIPGSTEKCEHNRWNYPPYVPQVPNFDSDEGSLYDKTICMDAQQHWGSHYNTHSLYGHSMAIATYKTLREMEPTKRPFVITRSNWAGTSKYAIHWLGDNLSNWTNIHWSIIGMLEYSMFGFSMTGADVCGFGGNTTEELCIRWMQVGAFYPFLRNHNAWDSVIQDPAAFSNDTVKSARKILLVRYKLLPYLYTLLFRAHIDGTTVARPLFFEFPADDNTWAIDRQFLWGSSLLISPAMDKGQTKVEAYFPKDRWFDYFAHTEINATGEHRTLLTPLHSTNVHVRGGTIIPWQEPDTNTVKSRVKAMGILVALDEWHAASGELFWDDGDSYDTYGSNMYLLVEFTVRWNQLSIFVTNDGYTGADTLFFETIEIYGLDQAPSNVTANDVSIPDGDIVVSHVGEGIYCRIVNQKLKITDPHVIKWVTS